MPAGFFSSPHFTNLSLAALAAYLVGAIPFGLVVAFAVSGRDVRQWGSGNIGATNVGRMLGFKWFVVVFLLDMLKGAVPVMIATLVQQRSGSSAAFAYLPEVAALAAILGHMFPVYLKFKGGKGVATSIGAVFALAWQPALAAVVAFVVVFALTRYVSLGSIIGSAAFTAAYFWLYPDPWALELRARTILAVAAPLLIIVAHRTNIVRIFQGREARIGVKKPPAPPPSDT